jgi:YHS domain-containing protein
MLKTARIVPFALIAALYAAGAATPALAAPKPETYVKNEQAGALGGYDPVAYFSGTPAKGQAGLTASYKGATYRFATAENRAKFLANASAYAPQYGGYCAWAAARGYTAPGDPRYWKVVGGKLYVNYDAGVQKKWEKDIPGFIAKADKNWPGILSK